VCGWCAYTQVTPRTTGQITTPGPPYTYTLGRSNEEDLTLSVVDDLVWIPGAALDLACVLLALSKRNSLPFCPFRNLLFPVAEDEKTRLTFGELDVSVVWIRILHPRTAVHHVFRFIHEGNVRMTKD